MQPVLKEQWDSVQMLHEELGIARINVAKAKDAMERAAQMYSEACTEQSQVNLGLCIHLGASNGPW